MRTNTVLALVAVLFCTACADQSTTARMNLTANPQFSTVQWDQATAPTQAALTKNYGLIMMR
jgi:hypothetical protein